MRQGARRTTNLAVSIAVSPLHGSLIGRNSALNAPLRFASKSSETTIGNTEQNEHFDVLLRVLSVILGDSRRYESLQRYLHSNAKNRFLNAQAVGQQHLANLKTKGSNSMSVIDYDNIEKLNEDLERRLEEHRQERIAQGKPAQKPEFIPIPYGVILLERIEPVREFLVKYALLINQSKQVPAFDLSTLDKYRSDLELLQAVKGVMTGASGALMRQMLEAIEKAQKKVAEGFEAEEEVATELSKSLYLRLQLLDKRLTVSDEHYWINMNYNYYRNNPELDKDKAEYGRLKANPEELEKELAKYRSHFESIKEEF